MQHNPLTTFRDEQYLINPKKTPAPKCQRGWGQIYDAIFNEIGDELKQVTEIGIGIANCPVQWRRIFPDAKVVGIDIASPVLELCAEKGIHANMHMFSVQGQDYLAQAPMRHIHNIDLYYNRDAYTPEVAAEFLDLYGKQHIVINDGKQNGYAHNPFKEHWMQTMLPGGLLVQERIARNYSGGIRVNQLDKAINRGWLVYDCREYVTFDDPNQNGFMGIYTDEPERWAEVLKDFRRVTDAYDVEQIELEYQGDDLEE